MTESRLLRHFYSRLLVPTILINMVSSVGSFFDAVIVGNLLGEEGLVAVTYSSPIFMIINTAAALISIGCMNEVGRLVGMGDAEAENRLFTLGFRTLVITGAAMAAAGILMIDPLVAMLGASGSLTEPTKAYVIIIIAGSVVFMLNAFLGFFIRMDGNPNLAMTAILISIGLSIGLDILFIGPCRMGIGGSALALLLSQVVSILIMCLHFIGKKHTLSLVRHVKWSGLGAVCRSGIGTSATFIYRAIALLLINNIISIQAGQTGMEVYTVVYNVSLVAMTIFEGISQTVQPFISTYHGEKNSTCKKITLRLGLVTALILCAVSIILLEIFPDSLSTVFGLTNPLSIQHARFAVRAYAPAIFFMTLNVMMSYYFQAVEHEKITMVIVALRELILLIGFIFLLGKLFGLDIMWFGYLLGEVSTLGIWALIAKKTGKGDVLLLGPPNEIFLREEESPDILLEKMKEGNLPENAAAPVQNMLADPKLSGNRRLQLFIRSDQAGYVAFISGDAYVPDRLPGTAVQACNLVGMHRTMIGPYA